MIAGIPLINGVEFTHADIVANVMGVPIIGITKISYSDPQEITLNHGTGQHPASRGFGPVTPEASITMTMKEVQRLSNIAPAGRIQNLPDFDIRVNFINEAGDFCSHRLIKVRFKGRSPDSSVNNSQIEEVLDLSVAAIDYAAA